MRRLAMLLSFAVLSAPTARDLSGQVDLAAAVEAREIAFARAMADRDLDAFLTFISPEAVFFNGNEPLRGLTVNRTMPDIRG